MPYVEHFRVEESLVVTGTGAITTGATPVAGSQTFADAAAIGDTFPLWIVDSTVSPPTIEASLGTYTAANTVSRTLVLGGSPALVTFLGNACSVFIARIPGGNAAQVFNAAQATAGTEVVTLAQVQADFAALAGLNIQDFSLFTGYINNDLHLNRNDGTAPAVVIGYSPNFRLISTILGVKYTITVGVDTSSKLTTNGNVVAVDALDNNFTVPQTLPAATAASHAVNLAQVQADFAALAGLSTQPFEVAAATLGTHSVNLGQADGRYTNKFIQLLSTQDIDLLITPGFYGLAGTTVNLPAEIPGGWAQLIVGSSGTNGTFSQIIIPHGGQVLWSRGGSEAAGVITWGTWVNAAVSQYDNAFLVPQTVPNATGSGHAVNLGQAQAAFAPITQNNAPVDRIAAGDLIGTVYTNSTARTWVDTVIGNTLTITDIDVNGTTIASITTGVATAIIPPGGTIELVNNIPNSWMRQIL